MQLEAMRRLTGASPPGLLILVVTPEVVALVVLAPLALADLDHVDRVGAG